MPSAETELTHEQPWPDQRPYTEADFAQFHGRKRETEEILHLIERDAITLVVGPASVGKTSIIRAGVLPALEEGNWLPVLPTLDWTATSPTGSAEDSQPTEGEPMVLDHPLTRQLVDALTVAADARGLASPTLLPGDSLWEYFHRTGHRWWSARQQVITPVVIIDGFEEAFTTALMNATAKRHAQRFLEELSELAENRPPVRAALRLETGEETDTSFDFGSVPVRVVIVMREEFLGDLALLRDLFPTFRRSEIRVSPFSTAQARDVLLRSSLQANLFADGALDATVARLSEEAGSSGLIEPAKMCAFAHALAAERIRRGSPTITEDFVAPVSRPAESSPAAAVPTAVASEDVAALHHRLDSAERARGRNRNIAIVAGVATICAAIVSPFQRQGPEGAETASTKKDSNQIVVVATPTPPPIDPTPLPPVFQSFQESQLAVPGPGPNGQPPVEQTSPSGGSGIALDLAPALSTSRIAQPAETQSVVRSAPPITTESGTNVPPAPGEISRRPDSAVPPEAQKQIDAAAAERAALARQHAEEVERERVRERKADDERIARIQREAAAARKQAAAAAAARSEVRRAHPAETPEPARPKPSRQPPVIRGQ